MIGSAGQSAYAQPEIDKTKQSFDQSILGLFSKYCFRCHGKVDPSAEIDLQTDENPRLIAENAELWERVRDQIESGAMPPEDKPQPNDEQRGLLLEFLNRTLSEDRCGGELDPGEPSVRRLNRFEYNRCLSELLGMPIEIADDFPPDPNSYGFLNNASALELDTVLVTQYYQSAKQAINDLVATASVGNNAYDAIFLRKPHEPSPDRSQTRAALIEFAGRAFRRPLAADDTLIERWLTIYDNAIKQNKSHVEAMTYPLISILISPRFLLRAEVANVDADAVYRVDDHDLATRLSFFLWSQSPDAELRDIAATGKLSSDQTLREQARRMLRDDRVDGLLTAFFEQWLSLSELESHPVDAGTFPQFNDELKRSMKSEVRATINEIVRENRSIVELIDAEYVYIDQRLATHYGLPHPDRDQLTRITLDPAMRGVRGGVLTSAAVLTLLSDPARTNVPKRGKFVASVLLASPPPPPPPNVPPLEATEASDQPQTTRARLEQHRRDPQCASCHAKMDPLGFALENYDAIGRWRDTEHGIPIDASGTLADESFDGVRELKMMLKQHDHEFAKSLVESLMIYALGRGLNKDDQCAIDKIIKATQPAGYRFGDIVENIVISLPMTHRRNPEF
jgi:hypothetical protein